MSVGLPSIVLPSDIENTNVLRFAKSFEGALERVPKTGKMSVFELEARFGSGNGGHGNGLDQRTFHEALRKIKGEGWPCTITTIDDQIHPINNLESCRKSVIVNAKEPTVKTAEIVHKRIVEKWIGDQYFGRYGINVALSEETVMTSAEFNEALKNADAELSNVRRGKKRFSFVADAARGLHVDLTMVTQVTEERTVERFEIEIDMTRRGRQTLAAIKADLLYFLKFVFKFYNSYIIDSSLLYDLDTRRAIISEINRTAGGIPSTDTLDSGILAQPHQMNMDHFNRLPDLFARLMTPRSSPLRHQHDDINNNNGGGDDVVTSPVTSPPKNKRQKTSASPSTVSSEHEYALLTLSHKVKGYRKMLCFTSYGVVLAMAPATVSLISRFVDPRLTGTFIDGELCLTFGETSGVRTQVTFCAFDVIAARVGGQVVRDAHLYQRRSFLTKFIESGFCNSGILAGGPFLSIGPTFKLKFMVKESHYVANMSELRSKSRLLIEEQNNGTTPFETDLRGMVATYNRMAYLGDEVTGEPAVWKIKDSTDMTIDFVPRMSPSGQIELCSMGVHSVNLLDRSAARCFVALTSHSRRRLMSNPRREFPMYASVVRSSTDMVHSLNLNPVGGLGQSLEYITLNAWEKFCQFANVPSISGLVTVRRVMSASLAGNTHNTNEFEVLVSQRRIVKFEGTKAHPWSCDNGGHVDMSKVAGDIIMGRSVVEFAYDAPSRTFSAVFVRRDKFSPNRETVAKDVFDNLHAPVTMELFAGVYQQKQTTPSPSSPAPPKEQQQPTPSPQPQIQDEQGPPKEQQQQQVEEQEEQEEEEEAEEPSRKTSQPKKLSRASPEMLLDEGDDQQWTTKESAVLAILKAKELYFQRTKAGYEAKPASKIIEEMRKVVSNTKSLKKNIKKALQVAKVHVAILEYDPEHDTGEEAKERTIFQMFQNTKTADCKTVALLGQLPSGRFHTLQFKNRNGGPLVKLTDIE